VAAIFNAKLFCGRQFISVDPQLVVVVKEEQFLKEMCFSNLLLLDP